MKIEDYSFGKIRTDGRDYTVDLWIINGKITRRHKSISRSKIGTSHKVSKEELERIVTGRTRRVIVGTGSSGLLSVEKAGVKYLEEKGITLEMYWSGELESAGIEFGEYDSGVIHLTC